MAKKNPNVGCRGGDYLMPIRFRNHDELFVRQVQAMYRRGWFTQKQIARDSGISIPTANKMCRVDYDNVAKVRQTVMRLHKKSSG